MRKKIIKVRKAVEDAGVNYAWHAANENFLNQKNVSSNEGFLYQSGLEKTDI